jgi:CRP/FNR family transcriptional regulator
MLDSKQFERAKRALPVLRQADAQMRDEFKQNAYMARIPAGRDVFAEGDRAEGIALLLNGVVRVYKIGETGREITLYRFGTGESCVLTANAILSQKTFPALATVEEDAEAIMIPADTFRLWVGRSDLWRGFVFDLLSQRLATMLAVVDEVTFRRMDSRLAALLLERSALENPIRTTHQEIAAELGSSREVISRILADFAALGFVSLSRGTIEVLDRSALMDRAAL